MLEEDIGTTLFERSRSGIKLTEAGHTLVEYARRALLELDRARAEITGSVNGVGGLFTVGLLSSTCETLSSPLVSAIAATYPGIRTRVAMAYSGTLQQWLETGEVDAALLYGVQQSPAIQTKPLVEEALWVVGPPSAKLRKDRPVSLASLVGTPMILPSPPHGAHGIRILIDYACAVSHVELTVAAETNALGVQKNLVLRGHGLTILPAIAVAEDVARKLFTAAPVSDPRITRTIVLALPANRVIRRHVRGAVDLLVQCVKDAAQKGTWFQARWIGS